MQQTLSAGGTPTTLALPGIAPSDTPPTYQALPGIAPSETPPTYQALPGIAPSETPPTYQALPGFSNFTDNFIDPTSGWPVQTTSPNQWFYANNHFYISVGSPETQVVVTPGYILGNGVVMAEGTLTQDQPQAYYGVVCRFQDINNYYFFEIALEGYYRIGKIWNGQWSLIVDPSTYSPAINAGPGAYNQVAGHCRGNELSLFVNDIHLATGYDNTFTSGQIGLSVSAGGFPGVTAEFDRIFAEE